MNLNVKKIVFTLVPVLVLCLSPFHPALAQELTDEMRNMFEQIVDDLDDDLQVKFRKAMDENRNTIRFSPDEFKRFRDNPINPFDGIQDINPDQLEGSIELKFELPSLRNRLIDPFERQHETVLSQLDSVAANHAESVTEILKDGVQVALGMVVDASGSILTKNSELADQVNLEVVFSDGMRYAATVARVDKKNDLAILNVRRTGLKPIRLTNSEPLSGAFVVTPGRNGIAIAMGTYSGVPRALAGGKQGFLGVQPQTVRGGVLLVEVNPEDAGGQAGLINGDIVTSIASRPMLDVTDLVNEIRNHQPGDSVEIEYIRNGGKRSTTAILADRNFSGLRAARFKMMNGLGAIPSERADRFPWVFQHDTPLFPEQCGGPILDLDGNVIGINIARGGRAASYAIPSSHLLKILPDLLRTDVASRN